MDIFKLYRNLWDYAFSNPKKLKPTDIAIYAFAIEHCNRLGWKKNFGFPTSMVMEATGIKSYSVFKKHFDRLVDIGFFEVIEYSKNQYSSNIIALKENYKALDKALDKAMMKHASKQVYSTGESIDSINKPITYNNQTIDSTTYSLILSLKSEIENLKNEKINIGFGKDNTQGENLSPFATRPARPLSDFVGQKNLRGETIE